MCLRSWGSRAIWGATSGPREEGPRASQPFFQLTPEHLRLTLPRYAEPSIPEGPFLPGKGTLSPASPPALPEDVGVAEPVHQLHLAQHVPSVAGQLVHLQHQDLSRLTVPHLWGQPAVTLAGVSAPTPAEGWQRGSPVWTSPHGTAPAASRLWQSSACCTKALKCPPNLS